MSISISHAVATPFLLPGNLACRAAGFWTVLGVAVVALAV
jgi:hypothetical protein